MVKMDTETGPTRPLDDGQRTKHGAREIGYSGITDERSSVTRKEEAEDEPRTL